jgi:hypothetical protein
MEETKGEALGTEFFVRARPAGRVESVSDDLFEGIAP